jgi:hypothetical protein
MKNYLASPIRYTTFHKESSIGCAGDKSSEMVIHWVCGRQPLRKGHHWERKLKECFNLCLDIATYVSLTYSMDNFLIMVRPRNDNVLIMVRLRNDNFLIMVKLRNDSYWQLDIGSKLTDVSLLCLSMALYLNDGWGHWFPLKGY